jgi:hypothetical protein
MKNPPTEPNFYFFSGYRIVRGTQRVAVDEPVRVTYAWHRAENKLGVWMLGKQRHYPLECFIGTWQPISPLVSAIGAETKGTDVCGVESMLPGATTS